MRRRLIGFALACAVAAVAAPIAAASRPPIELLGETNALHFDDVHGSGQRVLVRSKVTFSDLERDNPDLQLEGGGAIAAFLLLRDGDSSLTESLLAIRNPASVGGFYLDGPRVPTTYTETDDCVITTPLPLLCGQEEHNPHLFVLEPGYYRVIGIGAAPLTVHLHLHGLEGDVDLTPALPARGGVVPMKEGVSAPVSPSVAAGSFGSMPVRGLLYSIMAFDTSVGGGLISYDSCHYDGIESALAPAGFLPTCPGSTYSIGPTFGGVVAQTSAMRHYMWELSTPGPGSYGRGFTYTHEGTASLVDGYNLFLPFPK